MTYAEVARKELAPAQKVEAVYRLLKGISFDDLVDSMSNEDVVALQKFLWDKTVEIGLRVRGKNFTRREITSRMVPTPAYQREQNCSERTYFCKATLCILSNPSCARKKLKGQFQAMQEVVQEWAGDQTKQTANEE